MPKFNKVEEQMIINGNGELTFYKNEYGFFFDNSMTDAKISLEEFHLYQIDGSFKTKVKALRYLWKWMGKKGIQPIKNNRFMTSAKIK